MTKTIPEYEEKSLFNHLNKDRDKLILTKNEVYEQEMKKFKEINCNNPLEYFLEMVMYEIRQVKAFMQAIEGRRQTEKRKAQIKDKLIEMESTKGNIESGRFSIKTLFKPGSKDLKVSELTVKMEIMKNELNCLERMMTMMLVNTNYQLAEYRVRRGKEYATMFKKVAEDELEEIVEYEKLLQIPIDALP